MLNKNTYFQTDPLVAREFIVAPCPYSLIPKDSINVYYPNNKGIRKEGAGVIPATKGDLENKGFFDIQSNSLNLPRLIQIYNPVADARNEYIYSASGQKLKVLHIWDPYFQTTPILGTDENFGSPDMITITDYVGNMIYENNVLKRILIDGGYIEGGQYYYYLTDHLGNNRVVANANGAVVQKNHYYPFGMAFAETSATEQGKQPYKFGGKELDQMNGLNLYDNLARFYDPAIGRTLTPDPLCEKYYSISPYVWCANNPVNNVDLRGDSVDVAQMVIYDNEKHTNYTQTLTTDLQSETGLTVSVSADNQMNYAKDTNGNPIIGTTKDANGNIVQIGSATARNQLMGLIDNQNTTVSVGISNEGSQGGGNEIWLDPGQINSLIAGSVNVDSRTMGWGMDFLHESYHTTIGGGLQDSPFNPGPVVTIMNTIRSELNALGGNFGQRLDYYSMPLGTNYEYIPFNNSANISIRAGLIPGVTPIDKFIRRKP